MKKYFIIIGLFSLTAILNSCMEEVGDFTVMGEAISGFELVSPENNDTIIINTKVPDETIVFEWQQAESGLGSAISYTVIFDDPDGDFSTPLWSKRSDNDGADAKVSLTYSELQQVYAAFGSSDIASVKWNVKAENGSDNTEMGQVAGVIKIGLSADGISNFHLVTPLNSSILSLDGTLEDEVLSFDWEDASTTSGDVTYTLLMDHLDGDFSDPLLLVASDEEGAASSLSMTYGAWKTLLEQNGIEDGSYQWTVKAYSTDLVWMKEVFELYVEFVNWRKPIFIVGAATSVGWDINNALEMNYVVPNVWTGVYELKGGQEFKFFPEKGSWDNGIGADRFDNFIGCADPGNGNIINSGSVDGTYFVIVDLNTKTVTVSDAPKILGGSIIADWNTGNAVPMQMVDYGVYDTYQYITVDGWGFKFVPFTAGWDGDFGASKTATGFLDQASEDNLTVQHDGFYRVRTNMNTFQYEILETSWGIIGSATPGKWDYDTDMTVTAAKGSYVWSVDIVLTDGEIKFRANDGWDVNFGDNGADGSLEYGGANIAVSAGSYHIELILNSSTGFTYTITPNN